VDFGAGSGFWASPGNAADDVFGTPALAIPGPPPAGINTLVHDNVSLALAPPLPGITAFEDDLDGLECVGTNEWGGTRQPGNLHARVLANEPFHTTYGDLAPPAIDNHSIGDAPVFITVDRNSTGKALSAVRTQFLAGEAAGDVFMIYPAGDGTGTNLLLIDETEAGLYPGIAGDSGNRTDDMDALLLRVHPDDRYRLMQLASAAVAGATLVDPTPGLPASGDEYRTGPGFSSSLLAYSLAVPPYTPLRIRLGFSVSTDSVGLEGTAVDFEAGLDPSGYMQQAGDIFYTEFGPGTPNPAPASPLGMNWRWYEEVEIGLDAGTWVKGTSTDLADLPDELNALDSLCSEPQCTGTLMTYGYGCAGPWNDVPQCQASGWASSSQPLAFTVWNTYSGLYGYLAFSLYPAFYNFPSLGWPLFIDPLGIIGAVPFSIATPQGGGVPHYTLAAMLPPGLPPTTFAVQALIVNDLYSPTSFASTNAVLVAIQ
jgi:hypothetical protein